MAPTLRRGRTIAPAGRLLFYTDLPLTVLLIAGVFAAFSRYLEGEGCHADWNLAQLPIYVPEGFPCGGPAQHQAAWLLLHPSKAFLLSADSTHRCWMFVANVLTPLAWLLSSLLFSADHRYGIRFRYASLPLLRIMPKAMALAQLLLQGPLHTVLHIYTQRYQPVLLLHVLITAIGSRYTGLLDLPAFLALSLFELLLSLTIRYLLSMHGHATWTAAFAATNTFTYLGLPLLFAACVSGWERRSREQRRKLHGEGSCDVGGLGAAGLQGGGTGLGDATVTAAKIEGNGVSVPSLCSAGSSGKAGRPQPQLGEQQPQRRGHPVDGGTAAGGRAPGGGGGGGGGGDGFCLASTSGEAGRVPGGGGGGHRTAALSGPSLLAAAATAVAANNRARGGDGGGDGIPFDDHEKWASVITARQILAQPMAEWQPIITRQRVSIKVGPCMDWNVLRCRVFFAPVFTSVPVQIPGYEPEQLSPDWRASVQEVWDHSAGAPGTVKHVCVRRWEWGGHFWKGWRGACCGRKARMVFPYLIF